MEIHNYTYARQHLAELMEKVINDQSRIIITRQKKPPVVLLSVDEYEKMREQCNMLRSSAA